MRQVWSVIVGAVTDPFQEVKVCVGSCGRQSLKKSAHRPICRGHRVVIAPDDQERLRQTVTR